MSTGAQIEADWGGLDTPANGDSGLAARVAPTGKPGAYLSDEEILGIMPPSPDGGYGGLARQDATAGKDSSLLREDAASAGVSRDDLGRFTGDARRERNDHVAVDASAVGGTTMPEWLKASAADPKHAAEAEQLWQEHQAFRATFSTPAEARAIKELFPGGVAEAQALRQSTQELRQATQNLQEASRAIDQFDAAIFSGDARAQSELITEIARTNPAAFRSLFAEAAKVLGNLGQFEPRGVQAGPTLRENREGWGTQNPTDPPFPPRRTKDEAPGNSSSPNNVVQNVQARTPGGPTNAATVPQFDAAAYASFERATNDVVARDVRASVNETLARVLPDGIAEGAARRIGEDIFNEIHRTLASDRTLSEQVGEVLRGWRFGAAEQQRVAGLLAGRAKQLVPAVARRVIGEWTGSVLGTARTREARRSAAASRVDIAAPGGSLDSMPLRPMSPREIRYASMSDDDILSM
jgi:hypothetical protein